MWIRCKHEERPVDNPGDKLQHAFRRLEILFLLLNIVLCLWFTEVRRLEADGVEALPGDIKTGVC